MTPSILISLGLELGKLGLDLMLAGRNVTQADIDAVFARIDDKRGELAQLRNSLRDQAK